MIWNKILFGIAPAAASLGLVASATTHTHGPTEKFPHQIGSQVEHNGELHIIVGITGHSLKTVKEGLMEKPLYYVNSIANLNIPQQYARLNSREEGGEGVVAVLAAKDPRKLVHGIQRFEGPYAPWTVESMKEAGLTVVDMVPVTSENDTGLTECFKRAVIQEVFIKILNPNEFHGVPSTYHVGQTFYP